MSRTRVTVTIALGVASALGIAWLVQKRRRDISGLSDWRKVLTRHHGVEKAHQLSAAVRQQYAVLVAEASIPANQALRFHLKQNILPGLALYRVLLQEYDGNQQAALGEVNEAFHTHTLAKSRLLLAPLKVLPAPFKVFKLGFTQIMKQFPADGWDITYIENNDNKVAFNITRCFYLNTLTAYGAPELTASFCQGDDTMAELFPPSIRFVRPNTLGRGGAMCDFQYCRVQ